MILFFGLMFFVNKISYFGFIMKSTRLSLRFPVGCVKCLLAAGAVTAMVGCSSLPGAKEASAPAAAKSYMLASEWEANQADKLRKRPKPAPKVRAVADASPPMIQAAVGELPTKIEPVVPKPLVRIPSKSELPALLSSAVEKVRLPEASPVEVEVSGLTESLPGPQSGSPVAPDQCWAQMVIPSRKLQTVSDVVTQEGRTRFNVQGAQLRTEKLPIVIKDAGETFRVEPPQYSKVTETVKVKDEVKRLIVEPAVYENRDEQILIESARVAIRSCRAAGQRLAGTRQPNTSQTQCAYEVPAKYETITKRILVKPETVREEITPAVFQTITKMVLMEPAKAVPVAIPLQTIDVPVTKVASPAVAVSQNVQPVSKQVTVTQYENLPQLTWRRVVCEKDSKPEMVTQLQESLKDAGFDVGRVDGKLGRRTLQAVDAYQAQEGLAKGFLTYETLDHLMRLSLPK